MKLEEFQSILERKKCDFAIFYNLDSTRVNPNMMYFSGYGGLGALVIPRQKEAFLAVPEMEFERAGKSMIKSVFPLEKKKFFESIHGLFRKKRLKTGKAALDRNNFTLNAYKGFRKYFRGTRSANIGLECLKLREIKTENEIRWLRKSCSYANKILQKAISNFKDFRTESEAAAFLEYETRKLGLELSFNPIVASGVNGSMPHHEPSRSNISKGFCVLDFGVKYKGYCSDITRTICVGNPKKEESEIYGKLLEIQEKTIEITSYNRRCSELYKYVNDHLGKYSKNFTHGLGHGVGVEIHELPNLTMLSRDRITDNKVFTIEPGVYFPKKFGIRIEDTVLFKGKPIVLTRTTKELITITP